MHSAVYKFPKHIFVMGNNFYLFFFLQRLLVCFMLTWCQSFEMSIRVYFNFQNQKKKEIRESYYQVIDIADHVI